MNGLSEDTRGPLRGYQKFLSRNVDVRDCALGGYRTVIEAFRVDIINEIQSLLWYLSTFLLRPESTVRGSLRNQRIRSLIVFWRSSSAGHNLNAFITES